jgi:hypothetical protein
MADRECPLSAEHFKHINDRKWRRLEPLAFAIRPPTRRDPQADGREWFLSGISSARKATQIEPDGWTFSPIRALIRIG